MGFFKGILQLFQWLAAKGMRQQEKGGEKKGGGNGGEKIGRAHV